MIRRSRISVRPNVKPAVRTAAPSREVHADLKNHAVKTGAQEMVTEVLSVETKEKPESPGGDVPSQSDLSANTADVEGQSASTSSVSTRRKRFSVLPNLTKHRSTPSSMLTSSKLHKSHARPEVPPAPPRTSSAGPESPDKNKPNKEPAPEPIPNFTEPTQSPAPTLPSSSVHGALKASRFHTKAVTTTRPPPEKTLRAPEPASALPPTPPTPSERKSKRRKLKPVTPTQDKTETSSSIPDKAESHSANQDAAESSPPNEEVPADPLVSVPVTPNEPDLRDGSDLSSPGESNKPQRNVPLALRTLNDPVDRLRLARARKLRELLKKEINKDKTKLQRVEPGVSHRNKIMDHTKMTMRELIYYLPSTNPMSSYGEDEPSAETDSPPSPKAAPAVPSASVEDVAEEEEDGEGEEEEPLLAPRVKVAEDGSLIIDEESLTVRVQRMKGPNPVEERDPIFERGSTTTYSSFRKGTYTKPWSSRETDMFFLAISMVGTDFSMIGQLFPHRARIEIKNKFKKEERVNSWRIDKAFKEKRCLDLDFFSKLLARILKDEEKKRTKRKRTSQISKLHRRRPGERKRKICSSDSEEDRSSSSDAMDGENEDENEDEGSSAAPKRNKAGASQKKDKPPAEQEAEEEPERMSPAQSRVNELDSQVEEETERFSVKPGRRNRGSVVQRKAQDTHSSIMEEREKRELHDSTASVPEKTTHAYDVISCGMQDSENEEEPDLSTIQEHILNKPTRSGRIPKLSQQMIRAAADEEEEDDEEEQLRPLRIKPDPRPRGARAERGMWSASNRGKSRLLTLRALTTDDDDDDDEEEEEECGTNREEENYPMNAEEENQAFVPMGLRSVRTDQSQVEETMEELDISVNVPDMLGISQNVVCPWSSCPRALTGMGSVSSEHQLNLHAGVNDFMAPDHMEVSEEAARTLLTIGHSAHVTQTGEPSTADDVIVVQEPSIPVHETVHMETPNESEAAVDTCDAVTSDPSSSVTSQPDPVITGNRTPTQDSVSTAEPISSQERKLLSDIIQPETVNIIQPEATLLNTRRKRLAKPNLNKTSITTRNEAAEAHACCAETFSSKTTPSQISTRTHDVPEEHHHHQTEGRSAVLLLEKKMEDGDTGRCVEDDREAETQQAERETKSCSSSSDCSMKPSQSVRRSKPKPNLVRSVRTIHTQRKRHAVPDEETEIATSTFTSIQQPEEGANVTPAPIHSVTATPHTNIEEHSGAVCDESPFIHSLTEVLPTLTERAGLVPDSLPLPETLSEPISAVEHASADVGATGPAGDQVFSQLLPDVLIPVSDTHETVKCEARVYKVQIKPNPVRRLSRPDAPSSRQTALEQPQPASSLSACSSSAGCGNSKTSPSSEQSREISPPPVRNETPPTYSPPPPSHSIGENINLSQLDPAESTATQVGAGSQPVHQTTLPTSTGHLTRPGRRPKGFLSFMSSTRRPSESTRAPPKAAVIPSRNAPRRAAASTATPRPPSSLPRPHPHPHPPHTSSRTHTETPSADQEPTSVSAFFFNNIFTVVDEQDGLD